MPWGLSRFQQTGDLHFVTFSCYHRASLLGTAQARGIFLATLERTRIWYGFYLTGFVVMPEHVHLLISEPERGSLAIVLQMLKQVVTRKLHRAPFWQPRYYDFNVWSEWKVTEKLEYMHRNPLRRGLVTRSGDWAWSSFRNNATGEECAVEIESHWTARRRELMGIYPMVRIRDAG